MSRCFPFPPPGYKRNGSCGEALIESIKLRREILESNKEQKTEKKEHKKEKKGKRREEKEKKKEKRQKEGQSKHANGGKGQYFDQYYQLEKSREEPGIGCLQKIEDEGNEQLERSGITEEHDQPLSPRELSDCHQSCNKRKRNSDKLFDCNQSCNKRKRSSSPISHDQRTVIRIRLPLKRHNEPHESHRDDQLVSTSGTVGTVDCITKVINGRAQQLPHFKSLHPKELHRSKQQVAPQLLPDSKSLHAKELQRSKQQVALQRLPECLHAKESQGSKHQVAQTSGTGETADCITKAINGNVQQLPNSKSVHPKEMQRSKQRAARTSGTGETADCITKVINGRAQQPSNSYSLYPKELQGAMPRVACTSGTGEIADSISKVINGSAQQLPNSNSLTKELQSSKQLDRNSKHTNLVKDKCKRMFSSYSALFQDWVPMPLEFEGVGDEDWLLKSKLPEERLVSKRVKSVDFNHCSKPTMCPRAQWVPEAEIYAMPYAVPF